MMKKTLLALLTFTAAVCVCADELAVELPTKQVMQEWADGSIAGKNSSTAIIGGKNYPGAWEYWYIESGDNPETFKLMPLQAVSPDSPATSEWKDFKPIFSAGFRSCLTRKKEKPRCGMAYGVSEFCAQHARRNGCAGR